MSQIRIDTVETNQSSVHSRIECPRELRRFFGEDEFRVEYDVDVEDVPRSVQVVPVLSQVCPVAWANGADVSAPVVDRAFLEALYEIRDVLVEMYPSFVSGGEIRADRVVEPAADPGSFDGSGMLFSHGADSLATYVRHRDENPILVSVKGWVISGDEPERWQRVKGKIDEFAREEGCESTSVHANIDSFLDTSLLNAHFKHHTDGGWYPAVGHGLGMLGVCAPLAHANRVGTLYMASTFWDGLTLDSFEWSDRASPWGSHPAIDDRIRWEGTRARHDGFEMTRQEKISLIANFVREGHPELEVRTCSRDPSGRNCNRCEKCVRTAIGLLVEGLDPDDHGFDVDPEWVDFVIHEFESGNWILDQRVAVYWTDIRDHLPEERERPPEVERLFEWIRNADFEALVGRSGHPLRHRLLRTGARHTPYPIYSTVYELYARVNERRAN